MAFEGLSLRLQEITRKIRGKARITESDLKEMLREVKLALLEADVNYKIVKDFIAQIQEKALGQDVLKSLTPGQQVVKIVKDLDQSIEGKHVLVVEDIVDTGRTLSYLLELLRNRGPESVKLCTLLDKPERRTHEVHVDYTGFEVPDEFVVGYGLDYAQKYRNLPYIGVVETDD